MNREQVTMRLRFLVMVLQTCLSFGFTGLSLAEVFATDGAWVETGGVS